MTYFGIDFNGMHSDQDLGLRVLDRRIGKPSKIKRKERVPFSNQVYDFSGIYGSQEYEERLLTYVFQIKDYDSKQRLDTLETKVNNWLMQPSEKIVLRDDNIVNYYFLAEVESATEFEEMRFGGPLTVTFTAYPFRISRLKEGHDIWDDFNFELDIAQVTDFNINGTQTVTLYNPGIASLFPTIEASSSMEIRKGNTTYSISAGESSSLEFELAVGTNRMTITGNGTISFTFYKELI